MMKFILGYKELSSLRSNISMVLAMQSLRYRMPRYHCFKLGQISIGNKNNTFLKRFLFLKQKKNISWQFVVLQQYNRNYIDSITLGVLLRILQRVIIVNNNNNNNDIDIDNNTSSSTTTTATTSSHSSALFGSVPQQIIDGSLALLLSAFRFDVVFPSDIDVDNNERYDALFDTLASMVKSCNRWELRDSALRHFASLAQLTTNDDDRLFDWLHIRHNSCSMVPKIF